MFNFNVTAIINTFNRKDHLHEAIYSVFAQTVPVLNLIIIDDGSNDGTYELVQEISAKAPIPMEYKYFEHAGLYPSRNRGLDAATGDYIAFMDDDDTWDVKHIERTLALAKRFPNAVFIGGFIARDGQLEPMVPAPRMLLDFVPVEDEMDVFRRPSGEIERPFFVTSMSASLLKSNCAQKVRFDSSMKLRGDILIVWQMAKIGDVILDKQVHAWAKVLLNSLTYRVHRKDDPITYAKIRAEASYWQAYALEKAIGLRRRDEVPALYRELNSELLGASIHLRNAGERQQALKYGMQALRASPSIVGLMRYLKLYFNF